MSTPDQRASTPAAADRRKRLQRRWHATLREHVGGSMAPEVRHELETALLHPREPIRTEQGWTDRHYEWALKRLEEHARSCPGGEACALLEAALGAVLARQRASLFKVRKAGT